MKFKTQKKGATIWIGLHTIEIYIPYIIWKKDEKGLFAQTIFFATNLKNWSWMYSVAVIILGFGVGWAYNHCDNPNYVDGMFKGEVE